MANLRYGPEHWREVDELLKFYPVKEMVDKVPMSEFAIRKHAREKGINLILPKPRKKGDTKAVSELLARWPRAQTV